MLYGQKPPIHLPCLVGESATEVVDRTLEAREAIPPIHLPYLVGESATEMVDRTL